MDYLYFDESKIFDVDTINTIVQYKENNKMKYFDLKNEKEIENPDKYVKANYILRGNYYKNYENKFLVGLEYETDGLYLLKNNKREWNLIGVVLIDKNKKCYVKINQRIIDNYSFMASPEERSILDLPEKNENNENLYIEVKNNNLWLGFHISNFSITDMCEESFEFNRNLQDEASSFFGNEFIRIGNDKKYPFGNTKIFKKWIESEEQRPGDGNVQIKINEYSKLSLKDVSVKKHKKIIYDNKNILYKYAYVQRIGDVCVLRTFLETNYFDDIQHTELFRLYVEKNKITLCKLNNFNELVPMKGNISSINFDYFLINNKKESFDGTLFEYLMKHFKEFDESKHFSVLFLFIKYPILEKLYNAGFDNLIKVLIEDDTNINSEIKRIFGKITNKSSLNSALGINKKQILKLKEKEDFDYFSNIDDYDYRRRYVPGLLNIIKVVLDTDVINSLDEQTYDEVLDIALQIQFYYKVQNNSRKVLTLANLMQLTKTIKTLYDYKSCIDVVKSFLKIISEKDGELCNYYINMYRDYIYMIYQTGAANNFKATFSDADEIRILHDAIVEVYNTMKNKYLKESFEKVSKHWDKYKFEDEDYIIITPKEPADLAKEGLELHHCVKGYTERVINKKTNIVFIRKKEEIEKPFFTVEITNDDTIQQIHGFCNRNVDTEPDLINFIVKWMENNNLKASNYDKVR